MTDQPTTAMGALRSLATTQTQIDVFSDQIIESVKNGEASPLEVFVQIKAFEKAAERIINEIRSNAVTEANKHPDGKLTLYGNGLETFEAGTKYNYAACGDPIWEQLDSAANTAIERRKERETLLRTIKDGVIIKAVNPDTGEEVTLKPAPKTSTTTIKVTIK